MTAFAHPPEAPSPSGHGMRRRVGGSEDTMTKPYEVRIPDRGAALRFPTEDMARRFAEQFHHSRVEVWHRGELIAEYDPRRPNPDSASGGLPTDAARGGM